MYPALGVRKLQDVVVAAGGVSQAAASKVIITRKDDPAHPLTVDYNPEALKPVIPDIQIFPGDSILVPRAGIVYVVGNVQRSGGYVLDGRNQLTVEEALALAGGSSHAPDLRHVQLVRTLDDGRKEMIALIVLLAGLTHAAGLAHDQACKQQSFAGTVGGGQEFSHLIGPNLTVVFRPLKDNWGWTLAVHPRDSSGRMGGLDLSCEPAYSDGGNSAPGNGLWEYRAGDTVSTTVHPLCSQPIRFQRILPDGR